MLILRVLCLPDLPEARTKELYQRLITAALHTEGLKLERNQVACFFPTDALVHHGAKELVLEVVFLNAPEPEHADMDRLKKNLLKTLKTVVSNASVVSNAFVK